VEILFPPNAKVAARGKKRAKPTKEKDVVKARNVPATIATTTLSQNQSLSFFQLQQRLVYRKFL
jgi:hypothetical protein